MRSVQVSKPKGPLEIVERDIPEPGAGKSASRSRHAASVTAIQRRKREYSRIFNTQGFLATRLQESSTQ